MIYNAVTPMQVEAKQLQGAAAQSNNCIDPY